MEKKSLRWSIAQTPKRSRNYLNEGFVEEERKMKVITATRGHLGALKKNGSCHGLLCGRKQCHI